MPLVRVRKHLGGFQASALHPIPTAVACHDRGSNYILLRLLFQDVLNLTQTLTSKSLKVQPGKQSHGLGLNRKRFSTRKCIPTMSSSYSVEQPLQTKICSTTFATPNVTLARISMTFLTSFRRGTNLPCYLGSAPFVVTPSRPIVLSWLFYRDHRPCDGMLQKWSMLMQASQ